MFKIALFAAAATLSIATAPVMAAPTPGAGTGEGIKISENAAPAAAHETRYCVIETTLGSRIPHKECHTRKEWIDQTGQDPLAKN